MDEYTKAERLLRKAMAICKETVAQQHPLYAGSLDNLASLYSSLGEYAKAEPLYWDSLKIRKIVFGETSKPYATSLHNLASLYLSMGRYAETEPLLQRSLEITRKVMGEENVACAVGLNSLAGAYCQMREYAKSEAFYEQALEMEKKTVGRQHPLYATSLNSLAILYHTRGEYDKAEPRYREALEVLAGAQGDQHPDMARVLNNFAELCESLQTHTKAAALAIKAARIKLRVATDVAAAMPEAQAMNFVSKELGPQNVLLSVHRHIRGPQEELYEQVWTRRGLIQQCVGRRQRQLQRIESPVLRQRYQESDPFHEQALQSSDAEPQATAWPLIRRSRHGKGTRLVVTRWRPDDCRADGLG